MNMHEFYFKKSSRKKTNYNSHLPIIRVPSSGILSQMTIYTNQWGTCSPSIYIQFIKTSVALYTIKTVYLGHSNGFNAVLESLQPRGNGSITWKVVVK